MIGLVLWYNPEPGVGMIWCEDQGPLAFLGPETGLPEGYSKLDCGDQLVISLELRDGVRYVRGIYSVTSGVGARDPRSIIAGYHSTREAERRLQVVA